MFHLRKGFTMIELVFVIVIIGLLAVVAIPKLAANRTDAESTVCTSDVKNFVLAISTSYTSNGYNTFKDFTAEDFTNGVVLNTPPSDETSAFLNAKVDTVGVDYYCYGEKISNFKGHIVSRGEYNITMTLENEASVSNPASKKAIITLKRYLLDNSYTKSYSL